MPNDDAAALWQALVAIADDGELTPAGLASRDSLRLEAGMPLYGNELSLEGDPFAAGLGPVVALSKEGDFVGKAALAAKKEAGAGSTSGRKLVGLKGLGRRAGRGHYPVLKDGNVVGEVTSGQPSPTLGYPVRWPTSTSSTRPHRPEPVQVDVRLLRGKAREPFDVVAAAAFYRCGNRPRPRSRQPKASSPSPADGPAGEDGTRRGPARGRLDVTAGKTCG